MRGIQPSHWLLNPYLQLGASAIFMCAGEMFLKLGASASLAISAEPDIFGLAALASELTWIAIALHVISFISWLQVLRFMPLTQAYPLINCVHVLVPLAAWLFLKETISLTRWAGIALVVTGIFLAAGAAAEAEEKL
jgi:undecaprenyl phosphate-alpha-L-ara4N flippase subunit ArnF